MRKDLTGQRFGILTVIAFDRIQGKASKWLCKCDCGNQVSVFRTCLVSTAAGKRTTSCGCFRRNLMREKTRTHGKSRAGKITPEYRAWANMKDRCNNPNNKRYRHYGGRGITYCERWQVFENFLSDMGDKPSKNYSLDRINNDEGYCKENCKWSNYVQQNNNRCCVSMVSAYGVTMSLNQWAKETNQCRSTISRKIKRGVSAEDAIGHYTNPSALNGSESSV